MMAKKSIHGGRRKDAGRKPELQPSDKEEVAHDYFARMQIRRELALQSKSLAPRREAVIQELMILYTISHRMVETCLAEYLPQKRQQQAEWLARRRRKGTPNVL